MAKMNVEKAKEVYIDGIATRVPDAAKINDVVGSDVDTVEALNMKSGKFELIHRAQFNQQLPEGITTFLTPIEKGGQLSGYLYKKSPVGDCKGTETGRKRINTGFRFGTTARVRGSMELPPHG